MIAMIYVLYQLTQAQPHPVFGKLSLVWNVLAVATWLSLVLTGFLVWGCVAAWRQGCYARAVRVYYSAVALAAACWVPFVVYWDLVRPAW
jgi:hypothetical protein